MTTIHQPDPAEVMDSMAGQISMPYTLTPGRATGIFLAELPRRRLIGSVHGDGEVLVPAQDFSGSTGEPAASFVELAPVGTLEAFTTTADGTTGLVRLDGADVALVHRLLVGDRGAPEVGARVEAVWSDEPTGGFGDLAGFRPIADSAAGAADGGPRPVEDLEAPLEQVDYEMTLNFQHSYGHYYGTLFDGVKHHRRIRGVVCSECERVLVPPRSHCDVCCAPTHQWADVSSTGTLQACSVVHIEFMGQRHKPPYIYAEIVLDGSSTRLIHMVGGEAAEADLHAVSPGDRVRAVWSDRRTGSLADIEYFELLPEEDDAP